MALQQRSLSHALGFGVCARLEEPSALAEGSQVEYELVCFGMTIGLDCNFRPFHSKTVALRQHDVNHQFATSQQMSVNPL